MRALSLRLALVMGLAACDSSMGPADGGTDGGGPPVTGDGSVDPRVDAGPRLPPGSEPEALLELVVLDIWGQPFAADAATLTVTRSGAAERTYGWPEPLVLLRGSASYEVALTAPDHEALSLRVDFAGGTALDAITVVSGAGAVGHGVSVSHDRRRVDGIELPVHTVYLGLRHLWFSASGRPARGGNDLRLYIAGDEAWADVSEEIESATESVHGATWWWESNFELLREEGAHPYLSETERQPNTVLAHLDRTAATSRILVGQLIGQDGLLSSVTVDGPMVDRGSTPGDGFEYMGQANPTRGEFFFEVAPFTFRDVVSLRRSVGGRTFDTELPIESTVPPSSVDLTLWPIDIDIQHASYHQKFWVIDGRVAFIGGMNLRRVDWDTEEHLVFDPRRMLFESTAEDRLAVVNREALPDNGPRKDYLVRIEGPVVQDAEEIFHQRWEHQLSESVEHSEFASSYTVRRDQPAISGGVRAQVTATLPEPFWEHAIIETWFNAIDNAENYILIEDQYFRIPMLVDLIIERMTLFPSLRLIVITKPVSEFTDPGCEWTHRTHQDLVALFPTRYEVYTLRAFDFVRDTLGPDETEERFQDMDIHSKLLIVDDRFLSVGSCNKNNRGAIYEGELNIAVLDDAWVRTARRRVLSNILGPGVSVSDDVETWAQQLRDSAAANQTVWDAWDLAGGDIDLDGDPLPQMYTPSGFLYPLTFRTPDDCLIEGVGPDMT